MKKTHEIFEWKVSWLSDCCSAIYTHPIKRTTREFRRDLKTHAEDFVNTTMSVENASLRDLFDYVHAKLLESGYEIFQPKGIRIYADDYNDAPSISENTDMCASLATILSPKTLRRAQEIQTSAIDSLLARWNASADDLDDPWFDENAEVESTSLFTPKNEPERDVWDFSSYESDGNGSGDMEYRPEIELSNILFYGGTTPETDEDGESEDPFDVSE